MEEGIWRKGTQPRSHSRGFLCLCGGQRRATNSPTRGFLRPLLIALLLRSGSDRSSRGQVPEVALLGSESPRGIDTGGAACRQP